jgi:hypothetical protein
VSAQATCVLGPQGFNNPQLALYEWIGEAYRQRTLGVEVDEQGIRKDKIGPIQRLAAGDWRLRVYDAKDNGCGYELEGMFLGYGPVLE